MNKINDFDYLFQQLIKTLKIRKLQKIDPINCKKSFSIPYIRIMNSTAEKLNAMISRNSIPGERVLDSTILRDYVSQLREMDLSQKTIYVRVNALKTLIMNSQEVKQLSEKARKVVEIELNDICYSDKVFDMKKVQHTTHEYTVLTKHDISQILKTAPLNISLVVEFIIRTAYPGRKLVLLKNNEIIIDYEISYITIPVKGGYFRTVVVPSELIRRINQEYHGEEYLFGSSNRKMTRTDISRIIREAGSYTDIKNKLSINDLHQTTYSFLVNNSFNEQGVKYYTGRIADDGLLKERIDQRLKEINSAMDRILT